MHLLVSSKLHYCCSDSSVLGLSLLTVATSSAVGTIEMKCRRVCTGPMHDEDFPSLVENSNKDCVPALLHKQNIEWREGDGC